MRAIWTELEAEEKSKNTQSMTTQALVRDNKWPEDPILVRHVLVFPEVKIENPLTLYQCTQRVTSEPRCSCSVRLQGRQQLSAVASLTMDHDAGVLWQIA